MAGIQRHPVHDILRVFQRRSGISRTNACEGLVPLLGERQNLVVMERSDRFKDGTGCRVVCIGDVVDDMR